ncbi:AAEL001460-PA, partial [Aedes aegypti]
TIRVLRPDCGRCRDDAGRDGTNDSGCCSYWNDNCLPRGNRCCTNWNSVTTCDYCGNPFHCDRILDCSVFARNDSRPPGHDRNPCGILYRCVPVLDSWDYQKRDSHCFPGRLYPGDNPKTHPVTGFVHCQCVVLCLRGYRVHYEVDFLRWSNRLYWHWEPQAFDTPC